MIKLMILLYSNVPNYAIRNRNRVYTFNCTTMTSTIAYEHDNFFYPSPFTLLLFEYRRHFSCLYFATLFSFLTN